MSRTVALLLLIVAALPVAAQYKYTTPDGRTVYTDQPPPSGSRNVEQRDFGADANSVDATRMPYELRRAVEAFPVTLYTAPNCAPCDQGRALLNKRGIPFAEKTVSTAQDAAAVKAKNLGNTLPILIVGSNSIPNFGEAAWQSALDVAGYPKTPAPPGSFRNPAPTAAAPQAASPAASGSANAAPSRTPQPVQPQPSADNPAGIRF